MRVKVINSFDKGEFEKALSELKIEEVADIHFSTDLAFLPETRLGERLEKYSALVIFKE